MHHGHLQRGTLLLLPRVLCCHGLTTSGRCCAARQADDALARLFYACAIPFNVARSCYFTDAVRKIALCGPGYKAPGSEALRTTLLDAEYERVQKRVRVILVDVAETGGTWVSDGWSNVTNVPLINFLLVCPKGAVFLADYDTSGIIKDAPALAAMFKASIQQAGGPSKVVQVARRGAAWRCSMHYICALR